MGPGGPTVLLLHGLGADHRQPLNLLDVENASLDVVAPDLRAHGATRLPESAAHLTFDQLAADVEDLVAHLRLPLPVVILGISMGAAVATQLLFRAKLPIAAAMLVRPAWAWRSNPANLAVFADVAELLLTTSAANGKRVLPNAESFRVIHQQSPLAAAATLSQFDDPHAAARVSRLTAIPNSAPNRPPRPVPTPITVLACEQDPVHPYALAETVASDLGAALRSVPPRYDQPSAHGRAVNTALRTLMCES